MKALITFFITLLTIQNVAAQSRLIIADSGIARKPIEQCKTDLKYFNQVLGWQSRWPNQWQNVVSSGQNDLDASITYWSAAPQTLLDTIETLKASIQSGETAPDTVVRRVHQQIDDLRISLTSEDSSFIFAVATTENSLRWNKLIKQDVSLSLENISRFLLKDYLPHARKEPGLSNITNGTSCYLNAVKWWTGLELTAREIEHIGRQYLNKSGSELLLTAKDNETYHDILKRLKATSTNNSTTAEDLIQISESALIKARNRAHLVFSQKEYPELLVTGLPKHLQDAFLAGRYYSSKKAGSDARSIINPSRPKERRLMAEAIAFHEGIPGHHLWSTFNRTTTAIKYESGVAGLLEGWAIYAEYLADELDLYSSTYDRQGMIAKHLWAASRLIVEPGIHLNGWTREQAIRFMSENTLLSQSEIEIEVDRYIAMPGQSLSYILGADVILSERNHARQALREAFDIKAFHDVILQGGTRPLPKVREDIRLWVKDSMRK